jgi:hypothetical protein
MDSNGGSAGSSNGGNAGSGQAGAAGIGGVGGAPQWSCSGEANVCTCSFSTTMLPNLSCGEWPCCFSTTVATTPFCICLDAAEAMCTEAIDSAMGERVTTCPPP